MRWSPVQMIALTMMLGAGGAAVAQGSFRRTDTGIVVTPAQGPEAVVRLQVYGDGIIRVTSTPSGNLDLPPSLMVNAKPLANAFSVRETPGRVTLVTPRASAEVDLANGNVSFRDAAGNAVLAESGPPGFAETTAEGKRLLAVRQQFNRGTDEGFYGLGQHQNRQMNYNGEDVELAQHNMDIAIPFVVSTRNYGLLWDNNSITRFGDPDPYPFAGGPGDGLAVTGDRGAPGWTAAYSINGKSFTRRQEPVIDYQYIEDRPSWPAGTRTPDLGGNVPGVRVTWTGKVTPRASGLHRFRLYSSSYVKVFVDGKEVLERWRQNWNPWYHNFDLNLTAGKAADIRIEWEPNGGYIALLHNDPRPETDRRSLSLASELGHGLDYYFIAGGDMDGVISGYRKITGQAPLMPKWAYGFWQSRQPVTPKGSFATQRDFLGILAEYRKRGLPLDNIVQDWFYWPENAWGCHCFDPARFPDPQAMVDEIHRQNAQVMISVWPKYYPTTANYKELDAVGGIYRRNVEAGAKDWVGPGYLNAFYDPYNKTAQDIYWRQVRDGLVAKKFDAWWLDSDEPDFHSNLSIEERARRMGPTALGPGAEFFNSYPLVHVDEFHKDLLASQPDVRPVILSRSGYAGIQRASTALWSGDVASRWDDLRDQVSAGVNLSMSGIPNWSHDIGGFSNEDRYNKEDPKHLAEWRELNTRWFQFGAFSPLFRSHGEYPFREIYNISPKGTPTYSAMEWYSRLRYRLMPYIYTAGADTYFRDGTIMRGLVMDFPADRKAWNVDDQYLFGPAFLVAPVTQFKARSRSVYLPAGTLWYDFYTGRSLTGGQTVTAAAPYQRMPLFVRAGAIIPTGPAIQHTKEAAAQNGPITVFVYTGADGSFSIYEDDGVSRQYLNGAWSRIPLRYDERSRTLRIGAREGAGFAGMPQQRTIHVRWMRPEVPRALAFDSTPDATIAYDGREQSVVMLDVPANPDRRNQGRGERGR